MAASSSVGGALLRHAHVYLQAYAADGSPEGANEAVSDTVEFSAASNSEY